MNCDLFILPGTIIRDNIRIRGNVYIADNCYVNDVYADCVFAGNHVSAGNIFAQFVVFGDDGITGTITSCYDVSFGNNACVSDIFSAGNVSLGDNTLATYIYTMGTVYFKKNCNVYGVVAKDVSFGPNSVCDFFIKSKYGIRRI